MGLAFQLRRLFVEQQRCRHLAKIPSGIPDRQAQEHMRPDPGLKTTLDQTDAQDVRLEATEGLLQEPENLRPRRQEALSSTRS